MDVADVLLQADENQVQASTDVTPNSRKRSLPTEYLRDNLEEEDGEHLYYYGQFTFLNDQNQICFRLINFNTLTCTDKVTKRSNIFLHLLYATFVIN